MSNDIAHKDARILQVIIGLFMTLCVLNNVALPIFEASDEAAHFAYADFWAREWRLPNLRQEVPSHEAFQPPLYYAALAPVLALFDRSNLAEISQLNPDWFDREVNADYGSVANVHVHSAAEQFPYYGAALAVHVARFVSSFMGAVTIWLAYLIAKNVMGQRPYAAVVSLLTAALIAFNPKFIHVSSIVSNDIAVTLAATAACWWMGQLAGSNWQGAGGKGQIGISHLPSATLPWLILGGLIGVAGLCKIQAFGLVIPAGVLWLLTNFRSIVNRKSQIVNLQSLILNPQSLILQPLVFLIGFMVVSGWWFGLNWLRYGDPLAWNIVQAENAALLRDTPLSLIEIVQRGPQLFQSFWGVLGIEKYFARWVDWVLLSGLMAAVLGGVRWVFARGAAGRVAPQSDFFRAALGSGAHSSAPSRKLLVLMVWQGVALTLFLSWMRTHVGTENSRLLMPSVVLPTLLVALGWMALVPAKWHRKAATLVGGAMFALAVSAPFTVLYPAFAIPVPLSAAQLEGLPSLAPATFGGQVQLLRGQLGQWRVRPTEAVRVSLTWGAIQPISQSYRVLLEATDMNGELIARRRFIPYNGRFATQRWPVGAYFVDDYDLVIDANAQRGPANIQLALLSNENPPRLLEISPGVTKLLIGQVKIAGDIATSPQVTSPSLPLQATFGNILSLYGYDLVIDGGTGLVRLHLGAVMSGSAGKPVTDKNYTLFVHVLARDGTLLAQSDAQPLSGKFPTRLWEPGERVVEARKVGMSPNAARILLGWYDAATGQRLAALKPDGSRWPDDAVVILER